MARRNRREAAADSVDIEALPADPDAEIDATVCNCLYRLLPTLKAEYADVIWRADILGEPRDRLAASLGTSLNNVTVRLHRGRKALRMRLEEMCRTCSTHGFLDRSEEHTSELQSLMRSSYAVFSLKKKKINKPNKNNTN